MFGVVWAAAALGVVLNAISVERFKKVSMACYLAMGWVVVLAMGDFYRAASPLCFWCLLAGGVLYTWGRLYGWKKVPYMHAVFHLFVLGGQRAPHHQRVDHPAMRGKKGKASGRARALFFRGRFFLAGWGAVAATW